MARSCSSRPYARESRHPLPFRDRARPGARPQGGPLHRLAPSPAPLTARWHGVRAYALGHNAADAWNLALPRGGMPATDRKSSGYEQGCLDVPGKSDPPSSCPNDSRREVWVCGPAKSALSLATFPGVGPPAVAAGAATGAAVRAAAVRSRQCCRPSAATQGRRQRLAAGSPPPVANPGRTQRNRSAAAWACSSVRASLHDGLPSAAP